MRKKSKKSKRVGEGVMFGLCSQKGMERFVVEYFKREDQSNNNNVQFDQESIVALQKFVFEVSQKIVRQIVEEKVAKDQSAGSAIKESDVMNVVNQYPALKTIISEQQPPPPPLPKTLPQPPPGAPAPFTPHEYTQIHHQPTQIPSVHLNPHFLEPNQQQQTTWQVVPRVSSSSGLVTLNKFFLFDN